MAKEKDLIRKIIKWFKEEGGKAVKNHGSIFSEVGNPDIFASHPKIQKAIVIEAKPAIIGMEGGRCFSILYG